MHDEQLGESPPRTVPPSLFQVRVEEDPDGLMEAARQAGGDDSGRTAEDLALYEMLAAAGFSGMAWELFADALAEYAHPIAMSWLYTGQIFGLCRARGRPVRGRRTDQDMEVLRADRDEREELVCETIARALKVFRESALVDGAWRPDGGASMKTYFMGAVIGEFSGVYDRWASERTRRPPCDPDGLEGLREAPAHCADDPEAQAIGHDAVRRLLACVSDETTRTALFLSMRGYTMKEIGEHLNLSAAAVTMRLSRLRKNPPQQLGGPQQETGSATPQHGKEDA
ncbi:RNA polymerase sigma factor [Streptomyces gossypiisoli]|uniref:RNA polymerase sigma factor n=1 Tax=Streptomyces gossypiisoli TaxID=2748864 RepID=UPI0015DA0D82|nr:sigma-70 family RNA polymerase sigma factor [Streptomyces gossypiisoli]